MSQRTQMILARSVLALLVISLVVVLSLIRVETQAALPFGGHHPLLIELVGMSVAVTVGIVGGFGALAWLIGKAWP